MQEAEKSLHEDEKFILLKNLPPYAHNTWKSNVNHNVMRGKKVKLCGLWVAILSYDDDTNRCAWVAYTRLNCYKLFSWKRAEKHLNTWKWLSLLQFRNCKQKYTNFDLFTFSPCTLFRCVTENNEAKHRIWTKFNKNSYFKFNQNVFSLAASC